MLLKLNITNFAIIKSIVFEPSGSLNILTGETGAGKSIVMDALGLILGSRADIKTNSPVKTGKDEKCVVEGVFLLDKEKYEPIFESMDLDFEEETIIRREISDQGKSRSFINDTPVSLMQIKTITNSLVSIHSQHENSRLGDRDFQFGIIDAFAKLQPLLETYREEFSSFKGQLNALKARKEQQSAYMKEKDYLNYLLEEFENAGLQPDEEGQLENELNLLNNAEAIVSVADNIMQNLTENEITLVDSLSQLKTQLKNIVNVSGLAKELFGRMESAIIELKDISAEAERLRQSATSDPQRLEWVNQRLQLIQNLKRKHSISEYNELLEEERNLSDKLLSIGNIDREIEELEKSIVSGKKALEALALKLHDGRLKTAGTIELEIKALMEKLEMPKAVIKFELKPKEDFDEYGRSDLEILFTANTGMPLQPLNKVASGGELSRLALCFRSIEAENSDLSTLVFDEIDTGVSGKVADTIGSLFNKLSERHQVIAITHLPQVASYGDSHFLIGKREEGQQTVSYLRKLDKKERVDELAKMLSGNVATEIAKKNAIELLKN